MNDWNELTTIADSIAPAVVLGFYYNLFWSPYPGYISLDAVKSAVLFHVPDQDSYPAMPNEGSE